MPPGAPRRRPCRAAVGPRGTGPFPGRRPVDQHDHPAERVPGHLRVDADDRRSRGEQLRPGGAVPTPGLVRCPGCGLATEQQRAPAVRIAGEPGAVPWTRAHGRLHLRPDRTVPLPGVAERRSGETTKEHGAPLIDVPTGGRRPPRRGPRPGAGHLDPAVAPSFEDIAAAIESQDLPLTQVGDHGHQRHVGRRLQRSPADAIPFPEFAGGRVVAAAAHQQEALPRRVPGAALHATPRHPAPGDQGPAAGTVGPEVGQALVLGIGAAHQQGPRVARIVDHRRPGARRRCHGTLRLLPAVAVPFPGVIEPARRRHATEQDHALPCRIVDEGRMPP